MTKSRLGYKSSLASIAAMILSVAAAQNASAQSTNNHNQSGNAVGNQSPGAVDPGVRGGPPGAGGPVGGLNAAQQAFFTAAQASFSVIETVPAGFVPASMSSRAVAVTYSPRSAVRAPLLIRR